MINFLNKLWFITKDHHKSFMLMIFLFLLISSLEFFGIGMVGPFIVVATNPNLARESYWLNIIYKQFNFQSSNQFLIFLGLLVVIIFYVKTFLNFNAQLTVFKLGYNLKGDLSNKLMKAYMQASYSFHLRTNSATLIQHMFTTLDRVCIGIVMPLLTSISNIVVVLALTFLLVRTNSMALMLIAMLFLVVLSLLKPMKNLLARWNKEGWEASGEMVRVLNHGLGGLKESRIIGCEAYFERQMEEQAKKYATNLALSQGFSNLPRFVMEAFMISFLVVFTLIFINTNQEVNQNLTSVLGIFSLASIRLLPAAGNLVSNVNTVRSNTFAINQLFCDFQELNSNKAVRKSESVQNNEKYSQQSNNQLGLFSTKIVLNEVSFQYPGTAKRALDRVSFSIRKGESIGLIGRSGSGKTTLVDVLLGLFIPQSGDITFDGTSIYSDLTAWQNMLGYVPQSIFLIDDTLERNIAFGVPDNLIDRQRLWQAIEMAQLEEVVKQLPEGINTVVGERGVLLSGGQRQRVGIARVLYHERDILVFDEATAALDNETERLVTESTKALSGIKTIIIIAHRLSTIEHCDRIYQVDQGRILKSGSYQEVVLNQNK